MRTALKPQVRKKLKRDSVKEISSFILYSGQVTNQSCINIFSELIFREPFALVRILYLLYKIVGQSCFGLIRNLLTSMLSHCNYSSLFKCMHALYTRCASLFFVYASVRTANILNWLHCSSSLS